MTLRRLFKVLFLTLLAGVPLAHSKGSPDMILVSGGGLTSTIEIKDPSALKAFDPWMGQFADWKESLMEAPCFRRSFDVLFFMKWPGRKSPLDRGDLKMIYATRYCFTDTSGYVYLPSQVEPLYRVNAGTIYREQQGGKWFPATAAWDSLIRNAIASKASQDAIDMILISGGELSQPIRVTEPVAIRNFTPWTGRFVDWDHPPEGGRCGWEYEVLFFRRGTERRTSYDQGDLNMIYGLRYCLDHDGGPGYVHLAGRNDRFGPENVGMVWDGTHTGKWHHATADWNAFILNAVAGQEHLGK
jgi:hypothetical protein